MKKIKLLIFAFILFFTYETSAFAYDLVVSGGNSVKVGNTIAITATAKGLTGKTTISSSNSGVLKGYCEDWLENSGFTCYFTAVSSGSATITATILNPSDDDGNDLNNISKSINVSVSNKTQQQIIDVNRVYDKNNYLKSLSIDNFEISPSFNKDTLEYTALISPGTEKIKINAEPESGNASVKGIGEVNVSEGANTFNITVTAENGNERVYKITSNVEEKDPINVELNDNKYRVVKKKELLSKTEGYTEKNVVINGIEVPALYNEVTDVYLVGLKDSEGNAKLFSYDIQDGSYSEYLELGFDKLNLYIKSSYNNDYEKVKIKINDREVEAYKLDNLDDYYLLYGINTMTGNEGYYLYDVEENSIQRYDTSLLDGVTQTKDKYLSIVLVLSSVCFLCMLFLLIEVNKKEQ